MDFIKKLLYSILSVQEKFLRFRLQRTLGTNKPTKHKKFYGNGYLLSLDSLAEQEKAKLEEELTLILRTHEFNPLKIIEYITKQNTKVFYINNIKNLHVIGENEGFIYPQKGFKALYLSLLTENKVQFNTQEMFVLTSENINKYYFIYHFYNWFTFKNNIAGIDSESQCLLNKYLFNNSDEEINKLQLADIYKLKDAIKQDKAAIEFVFKLCQQTDGAKNALNKLKDSGTNI